MPNKIYLSGPDGAGKTTYAEMLAQAGYKIMKWTKPLPGEDYYAKAMAQIEDPTPMVLDRGWVGDLIYAPIFGEDPVITEDAAIALLKLFVERGGQLIYVKAEPKVLRARIKERGDEFITVRQVDVIFEEYERWFDTLRMHNIPYTILNTTYS